jgi:glyoxylase-like metal-dependent hydrolase (beta-lactamase superfamily II)/8-oxo-dGTP pyrophosphatase MutT (NUDIX family)
MSRAEKRPRSAASLLLWRDRGGVEVYLVKRAPELKFFGGYHAFPGGAVEEGDAAVPIASASGLDEGERAWLGCAVRELFEECGILLDGWRGARPSDGSWRAELASATTAAAFHRMLRDRSWELDARALRPAARFVTPRFSKLRFDTRFYFVRVDDEPALAGGELVEGAWSRPEEALRAWRRDAICLTPPSIAILDAIARWGIEGAPAKLAEIPAEYEGSGRAIPWSAGYEILPLHAAPLPPELPTNALLVGEERFVVIDPGPEAEPEREHLFAAIERRLAAGHRLEAAVLTHHHPDHVGALAALAARFGCPVWAHAFTGEKLGRRLDRALAEGDWIDLGAAPDGAPGWGLRCLLTPGHAEGHLAFHDERRGALIAGDLVSTAVSMYVGSPGGHLATYLRSLDRLRGLALRILYPSHGNPTLEAAKLIDETIAHRHARLRQVEALLGREPAAVRDLAFRIYKDIDPGFEEFFVRAARAGLEYLAETGRARRVGEDVYAGAG